MSRGGAAFEGPCVRHCSPRYATVILQLRAWLSRVLNLTDPTVRRELDLSEDEITGEDWARPQSVAREARGDGYAAIRFPSATGEGNNLAIFLDLLRSDDQLIVEDIEEVSLRP